MHAEVERSIAEPAASPVISGQMRIQLIEEPWFDRFPGLLRLVADGGEIMVKPAGNKFVPDNRLDCRQSDGKRAAAMVRDPIDGARNDFRLIDRGYRLRMAGHPG